MLQPSNYYLSDCLILQHHNIHLLGSNFLPILIFHIGIYLGSFVSSLNAKFLLWNGFESRNSNNLKKLSIEKQYVCWMETNGVWTKYSHPISSSPIVTFSSSHIPSNKNKINIENLYRDWTMLSEKKVLLLFRW